MVFYLCREKIKFMEFIQFSVEKNIARIVLNRPQVFNSMNHAMRQELLACLEICKKDKNIRAVLLTGNGKAFCAGQDLMEVTAPGGPSLNEIISSGYNPIVLKIKKLEKPVVCAVNGVAAGAGANIAFSCDLTVACEAATFTQAFSKIGLVPDSGGTWTLPRMIGLQKAMGLMLLSEKISATEAEKLGLIWKVFPNEIFETESQKMVETLAEMPTRGLAMTKKLLNKTFSNSFKKQLALEDEMQTAAGQTADYQEGVAAFLGKRKPVFVGK